MVDSHFRLTLNGCVLFQNLKIYIDPSETLHVLNQILSAPTNLRKSDLAMPHLCCGCGRPRCLFTTCKTGCGLWLWADENKMTTPTTTRKICVFSFTGLDQSCLTNLDWSRFVRFWKRTQPIMHRTIGLMGYIGPQTLTITLVC